VWGTLNLTIHIQYSLVSRANCLVRETKVPLTSNLRSLTSNLRSLTSTRDRGSEHARTRTRELFGKLSVMNTGTYLGSLRAWVKNALARNAGRISRRRVLTACGLVLAAANPPRPPLGTQQWLQSLTSIHTRATLSVHE